MIHFFGFPSANILSLGSLFRQVIIIILSSQLKNGNHMPKIIDGIIIRMGDVNWISGIGIHMG